MRKSIIVLFFPVLLLLSACSVRDHLVFKSGRSLRPANPDLVTIHTGSEVPGKKIKYIGYVVVDFVGKSGEKAVYGLKEEAAALGANAIINFRLTKLNGFTARCGASGIAVLAD